MVSETKERILASQIMLRVRCLCACLLLTVGVSSAMAQPRQTADLIIGGEFVVTIDEARPVIRDGAVAVHDGRIVAVGTAAEIRAAYRAPVTLPGEQRVLMPGLVNGHTHAAMVLFRGIAAPRLAARRCGRPSLRAGDAASAAGDNGRRRRRVAGWRCENAV